MRIGVGGGVGPFRAGVSNRGAGVGLGPLSAGTSFRSRGGGAEAVGWLLGVAVLIGLAYIVAAWPFLIGTWLATKLGAADPSAQRSILGWIFEAAYVILIVWILTAGFRARRRARRAAQHRAEVDRLGRFQDQVASVSDGIRLSIRTGMPVSFNINDIDLVGSRAGASALAVLDTGRLQVNDMSVQFVGAKRSAEWRWASIVSWTYDDIYLAIEVSSRKDVLGLRSANGIDDAMLLGLEWMRSNDALATAAATLADLDQLRDEVGAARADLS